MASNGFHMEVDNKRHKLNNIFYQFRTKFGIDSNIKNDLTLEKGVNQCYQALISDFKSKCSIDRDYSLGFYKYFYSACLSNIELKEMQFELDKYCLDTPAEIIE